jgi:hypothetical protein
MQCYHPHTYVFVQGFVQFVEIYVLLQTFQQSIMSIKIFHVKVIIYLKIFWTKMVNNIVLLNIITKKP